LIPAEIFPTEYRCRCHGISAASGKLGAILVQLILFYNPTHLGIVIGVFSIPMLLGALFTWVWIPKLQMDTDPKYVQAALKWPKQPSKGLEILARGIAYATNPDTSDDPQTGIPRGEAQRLGFHDKFSDLWRDIWSNVFKHGFRTRNDQTEPEEGPQSEEMRALPSTGLEGHEITQ
jgi:hypothetical protein